MHTPLVSIIVPIYKVEPYLRRCLDSIVNQTYTNLEIILVDDGSPDGCPQICDEYAVKDNRVVVIHKENGGLSDARNAGLDICKGEYIFFIDSDDFISKQAILTLYKACIEQNADIAIGNYQSFNKESEIQEEHTNAIFHHISFEDVMKKQLFHTHEFTQFVVAWNKLIKTEIAKKFPFPKGQLCEDNFTTFKYFYNSKAIFTKETTYYYQNREQSIVNQLRGTEEDYLISIKYFQEKKSFLESHNFTNLAESFNERISEKMLNHYVLSNDKEIKDSISKSLKKVKLKKRPLLNFAIHHPNLWEIFKKFF